MSWCMGREGAGGLPQLWCNTNLTSCSSLLCPFSGIIFLWEPLLHQQMRKDKQVHGAMVPSQKRWQSTTEQKHHQQNNLHLCRWRHKPSDVSLAQESPFSFRVHFFPWCCRMFLAVKQSLGDCLDCTIPACYILYQPGHKLHWNFLISDF